MTVYAIANNKGGVGKTTTAVNLAAGLAEVGQDVLLVDLDAQGNAADSLGMRAGVWDGSSGRCVSFVLDGSRQAISQIMPTGRADLFLLPASRRLRDVTVQLALAQVASMVGAGNQGPPLDRLLSHYLGPLLADLDALVLDCPPNLAVLTAAVYEIADRVIVPVQPQFLSARGAQQHTDDLATMIPGGALVASTIIVPTMVDARQVMARDVLAYLEDRYPGQVAEPVPDRVAIKEAPAAGQTVLEYAPDSDGAEAYRQLVARVTDGQE